MNIDKPAPLNNQILVYKSKLSKRSASDIDKRPFVNIHNAKIAFNNHIFKYLLKTIFKKLKDSSNAKYYVQKRWLVDQFERILSSKNKDNDIYNALSTTALFYYYHNPFDFEVRVTKIFYDFFQNHSDFKAEILIQPKVSKDYFINPFNAIKIHFFRNGKFSTFFINKLQSKKQIRNVFRDILWNEIETFLKVSDLGYQKRDDSALYNWVKNRFDYRHVRQLGLNTTYDFYFTGPKTIEKILNISKTDFQIEFRKEISNSLSISGQRRPPLTQVVHYYLLVDMIKAKLFAPIESADYNDAKSFVDSYHLNYGFNWFWNDFTNNLNFFLPGLKEQVIKFGLNWESQDTPYGLVFENDTPHKLLTPQDDTKSIYDFRFKFRFVTNYIDESTQNANAHLFKFNIPTKTKISDFQKAQNIVNKFINQGINWKRGYMNQPLWTEKDIVDWVSDFNTIEDFRNFITPSKNTKSSFEKAISWLEWTKFSSSNLQSIDFSLINNPDLVFTLTPIIIFDVNPQDSKRPKSGANELTSHHFGKVKVVLRLKQYSQNSKKNDLPTKKVDIEVKSSSEVLTMLKLINEKIRVQFPLFLYFQDKGASQRQFGKFLNIWLAQDPHNKEHPNEGFSNNLIKSFTKLLGSFWLQGFIDKEGNSIKKLNTEENFKSRSNIKEMQNFASTLVTKINREYRNNFQVIPKLSIEDNPVGVPGKKITLSLSLFDDLILKKKHYTKILYTNKMDSLGLIKSGEFKGKKGVDVLLNEKFSKARPLKTFNNVKLTNGQKISKDFIFLVGDQKYTIKDIENEIENSGFLVLNSELPYTRANVPFITLGSKVLKDKSRFVKTIKGKSQERRKFIKITYQALYYNYDVNKPFWYFNDLKIYIDHKDVTPEEIEKGYQEIIKNISNKNKKDKLLLKKIEIIFSQLKKSEANEWRNDVSWSEYSQVTEDATALISGTATRENIIKEVKKIYDNKIPPIVMEKILDPKYTEIIKEIIKQKDSFSTNNLKKILENEKLLDILNKQGKRNLSNLINKTLKVTKNVKYSYFGVGTGFGVLSLLAGVTSIRSLKLNKKAKVVSTSFKKPRYIVFLSLVASVVSALASTALMLIFFIEKSGF